MAEIFLRRGAKIHGPDGMGYELICDVTRGEVLSHSHCKPFGGAPVPVKHGIMPRWFFAAARRARAEQIENEGLGNG